MASFDEVVPPGKAGSIRASVHTANYKGAIGKSITVTHDDKSQGPIPLSVVAKIVGSVDVLPYPAMQLARHRRGFEEPALLLVRQDPTEKGTLAVDKVTTTAKWLKATTRKVEKVEPALVGLPESHPGDVIISIQASGAPVGTHIESVIFKTGLMREPEVTIPVTVTVDPAVTLQPGDLILNPAADGADGATGQVLVAVRDDLDPKEVKLATEGAGFSVRADPPGERAFRLIVDWSGKGSHAATQTVVHVKVGTETVDLPVRVNLARVANPS